MQLAEVLLEFGLTQVEVAKLIGTPQPVISKHIKSGRPMSLDYLVRLRDGAIGAGRVDLAVAASRALHEETRINVYGPPSGIDQAAADVYAMLRQRGVHPSRALSQVRRAL